MSAEHVEASEGATGREALLASAGILAFLGAVKGLASAVPSLAEILFTGAIAAQLLWPSLRIGHAGIDHDSLGLHLRGWKGELLAFALAATLTGVPYALGFWWLEGGAMQLRWPPGMLERVAVEVGVIGLSEELFFRGYIQERFQRRFPGGLPILGVRLGPAILLTSAVFALAHFVGDYRPARLATFFPSLVFGLLRARRGSLVAAVGYHAFCNLLADVMFASRS